MLRYCFLLVLLFFIFLAHAQSELNGSIELAPRIFIGVNVSPDYCFRMLQNKANDEPMKASVDRMIDVRNQYESPKFGYSMGLVMKYKISPRMFIGSGLQFSNKGYASKLNITYSSTQISPTKEFINPTSEPLNGKMTDIKFLYSHHYLDLPINLWIYHGNGKIKFVSSVGFKTSILLNSTYKVVKEYSDGSKDRGPSQTQKEQFNRLNLFPHAGFGVNYSINPKIQFQIEPTFSFGILNITDAPIGGYLWNAGLNFSGYYTLK